MASFMGVQVASGVRVYQAGVDTERLDIHERATDPELVVWAIPFARSRSEWFCRLRRWVAVRLARLAWRIAP